MEKWDNEQSQSCCVPMILILHDNLMFEMLSRGDG